VFTAAERIAGDGRSAKFAEIVGSARASMATIRALMKRFTNDNFECATLCDDEIQLFWESTDAVRLALHAVRVTDRGLDAAMFGADNAN